MDFAASSHTSATKKLTNKRTFPKGPCRYRVYTLRAIIYTIYLHEPSLNPRPFWDWCFRAIRCFHGDRRAGSHLPLPFLCMGRVVLAGPVVRNVTEASNSGLGFRADFAVLQDSAHTGFLIPPPNNKRPSISAIFNIVLLRAEGFCY